MKKYILCLFAFVVVNTNAQTFVLTSNGFVDANNVQKNFIVVSFEGKTQKEIYGLALSAIGKIFVSPKDRISQVEYNQINLNGVFQDITYISRMGLHLYFDLYFNLIFEFKDGRMKINALSINDISRKAPHGVQHMYLTKAERGSAFGGDKALFNNDGSVNEQKHKDNIEKTVNDFVKRIVVEMNKAKDSDW